MVGSDKDGRVPMRRAPHSLAERIDPEIPCAKVLLRANANVRHDKLGARTINLDPYRASERTSMKQVVEKVLGVDIDMYLLV
jgi:hypothetical protein